MAREEREEAAKNASSNAFNFEAEDFDGLKALKAMNREMAEAHARISVINEDTRRFLKSRNLKFR